MVERGIYENVKGYVASTAKPITASKAENTAHNLAASARPVCHHVFCGYFDELRQMANETNGMAMLESANSASNNAPAVGSGMPHPTTVHAPLTYQRSASGIPMSQKVHQRATWPVIVS